MSRKLWFGIAAALIVALVAGLNVSGVALASGQPIDRAPRDWRSSAAVNNNSSWLDLARLISGQVVMVGKDEFSIRTNTGQEFTFLYNVDTRFENSQKQALKAANLVMGDWVTVYASHPDRHDLGLFSKHAGMMALQSSRLSLSTDHRSYRGDMNDTLANLVVIGAKSAAPSAAQVNPPAAKPATVPSGTYPTGTAKP